MTPRLATIGDLPALVELIPASARVLSRGFYTEAQTEAAIRYIFGPDTRLITDGTYFVVEADGVLAGCGGWSRRATMYGGDRSPGRDAALLDPAVTRRVIEEFARSPAPGPRPTEVNLLTERELEVLHLVARGLSNAEIAATLVVSEATVKTHVARLLDKLRLRDRVQAVVYAYEHALVRPGAG